MPDINNTVALDVAPIKPPPAGIQQPDVIGSITSLAQLQYLQQQGALVGANAQFQQGKLGALQAYQNQVNSGTAPEDAVNSSGLGAYDPAGANALLGNLGTARTLKSNQQYSTNQDPNALAIQGPEAVAKAVAAKQDVATYNAKQQYAKTGDPATLQAAGPDAYSTAMNAIKTGGDVVTQRLGIAGQIANGVLAAASPDGTIDPAVRQDAIQKSLKAGLITPQQAQQEQGMTDGQFLGIAHSWAAGGMAAKDYAETSGQAKANQTAAETLNKPLITEPGQGVTLFPALAGKAGLQNPALASPAQAPTLAAPIPQGAPPAGPLSQVAPPANIRLPSAGYPAATETSGPTLAASMAAGGAASPANVPSPAATPASAASLPMTNGVARLGPDPQAQGPNYYGATARHETGNSWSAVGNGGGLYQFEPGTQEAVRRAHPELGLSPNWANNPQQAIAGMQAFTSDNAKILASNGIGVNDKNLYMAHFLGGPGASQFIKAAAQNPDTPAAMLFPKEAQANPTIFYAGTTPRTLGQVYALQTKGFGNGLTANNVPASSGIGVAPGVIGGTSGILPNYPQQGQLNQAASIPVPPLPPIAPPQQQQNAQQQQQPEAPAVPPATVAPIVKAAIQPEVPSAPPAPPPGSAPQQSAYAQPATPGSVDANGMTVVKPGMSLSQKAESEGQGKAYGELPAQLDQAASAAKNTNQTLDQLQQATNGTWQPGKWAPQAENAREMLQSVAKGLGVSTPELDTSIASYQDFVKTAGNISRLAAHETSSRVGVQEMQLINKSLPSPEMSDGGMGLVIPQMKGLNDFTIAKQQAAAGWRASNNNSVGPMPQSGGKDFQTVWNEQASPAAFVLHRMLQDNPEAAQAMVQRMAKTPGGMATLKSLQAQAKWAEAAGLMQ